MLLNINHGDITVIISYLKIIFIGIFSFYTYLKITNNKLNQIKKIKYIIYIILISSVVNVIRYKVGYLTSIFSNVILLNYIFSKCNKQKFEYSILITIISYCINWVLLFMEIISTFFINMFYTIKNDYINLGIMILIHIMILYRMNKIKKIHYGVQYLNNKSRNEFLNLIMLNICLIIFFSCIILAYMDSNSKFYKSIFINLIFISFFLFIIIQRSIQLYYKQKLLIQDLNETKKELEEKKKEIKILEEENLNFSKKSHSLAHKQKVLEHKINKLLQNNEYLEGLDLKNKVEEISEELYKDKEYSYISKTGITNIDDMLETMQEECKKSNIEFNVQICGNIFEMINNYVEKEDLEILLADHIKDAIIAVNHSNNVNRTILVKLGKLDNCFGLYFFDSGVEFNKEVLEKLGKRPITTYVNEGGTGMGFMNTFDTLKKYNASLIIKNIGAPSKENFTKIIMIKFDKNAKFCLTN